MTAGIVNLSEFRALRDLAHGARAPLPPTGCDASPPCADATGNSLPSEPESRRDSADRFVAQCATGQPVSGGGAFSSKRDRNVFLEPGDEVIDRVTRTLARVTRILAGPHGAPGMVQIVRTTAPAGTLGQWRRADQVERVQR